MTTINPSNPRGAGRKPLPPGAKKLKTSVSLAPDLVDELAKHGDGVLSRGIEKKVRDSVVTDSDGRVLGMVHIGPGAKPYQAWARKRLTGRRPGNSHTLIGMYGSPEDAAEAVRRGR
jgi:hypothetical protein